VTGWAAHSVLVSHVRVCTQFGVLDVAVRERPEGDWYARLDTSHPQLRLLPGYLGASRDGAVARLLWAVERVDRRDRPGPPREQVTCCPCEPPVRVRLELPSQATVGLAVAQTATQVWVVWQQSGTPVADWVPLTSVSELATGRTWLPRHRRARPTL
jgi:hypothetical protein